MADFKIEEKDYLVLKYVCSKGKASFEQMEEDLSSSVSGLESRFDRLAAQNNYYPGIGLLDPLYEENPPGSSRTSFLGNFCISDKGMEVIQDYEDNKRREKRMLWLKNAWIPVLVSIVTTVVVNALSELLPLIQQWASNIL